MDAGSIADAGVVIDAGAAPDARAPTDAGGEPDAGPALDADSGRPEDAGATPPDPVDLSALPCLGPSMPLVLSSGMPYVNARLESFDDWFVIDTAATASFLDNATWWPRVGARAGTGVRFELFGVFPAATFGWQDYSGVMGTVPQSGLIGTDFLSLMSVGLDYAHGVIRGAAPTSTCGETALRSAGLVPIALGRSAAGYFASVPDPALPLVPTVTLAIGAGGAAADAQLDTGFSDGTIPYSANVNPAFFAAIVASGVAPSRAAWLDLALTTCVPGLIELVEAWMLPPGVGASLDGVDGPRPIPPPVLFVKRTPPAASACGGVGTLSAPAAQLGASYFLHFGAFVLDPATRRLWIPPG